VACAGAFTGQVDGDRRSRSGILHGRRQLKGIAPGTDDEVGGLIFQATDGLVFIARHAVIQPLARGKAVMTQGDRFGVIVNRGLGIEQDRIAA